MISNCGAQSKASQARGQAQALSFLNQFERLAYWIECVTFHMDVMGKQLKETMWHLIQNDLLRGVAIRKIRN
jgi:hypothetical protein